MAAMVAINLLPDKARRGELITAYIAGGVALVLLVLGGFFAWSMAVRSDADEVAKKTREVEKQLASPELRRIVQEVREFTEAQDNLKKQAEVLVDLRNRQASLVRVLDLLPDVLPAKATIRKLETEETGGKNPVTKITMNVMVLDREVVPQFIENLSNRPEIKNVNIKDVGYNLQKLGPDSGHLVDLTFEVAS